MSPPAWASTRAGGGVADAAAEQHAANAAVDHDRCSAPACRWRWRLATRPARHGQSIALVLALAELESGTEPQPADVQAGSTRQLPGVRPDCVRQPARGRAPMPAPFRLHAERPNPTRRSHRWSFGPTDPAPKIVDVQLKTCDAAGKCDGGQVLGRGEHRGRPAGDRRPRTRCRATWARARLCCRWFRELMQRRKQGQPRSSWCRRSTRPSRRRTSRSRRCIRPRASTAATGTGRLPTAPVGRRSATELGWSKSISRTIPMGSASTGNGQLFVSDFAERRLAGLVPLPLTGAPGSPGGLYRFGLSGGKADTAHQLNAIPFIGQVVAAGGKLYATINSVAPTNGRIVELDPVDRCRSSARSRAA